MDYHDGSVQMKPLDVNQSFWNYCACGVWFTFMIMVFVADSWYVYVICVAYECVFMFGMHASSLLDERTLNDLKYNDHVSPLNLFRWMLTIGTLVVASIFAVALTGSILTDVANDRCSEENRNFVELYGNDCGSSKNAFRVCQEECIVQVRDHIAIESISLASFLTIGMLLVAFKASTVVHQVEQYRDPLLHIDVNVDNSDDLMSGQFSDDEDD